MTRPKFLILFSTIIVLPFAQREAPAGDFSKYDFTLNAVAGYTHGFSEEADIASLEVGGNYYIVDNLSLGIEISGYGVSQPGDDALAVGASAVLRHHLLSFDGATIFFDASFGVVESSEEVPDAGTQFNFISRAGVGGTIRLDDDLHLMLGGRYWHLSNARIEGVERNPSINGAEFYVGLMWKL